MGAFITVSVNWFNAFIIAAINYRLSELVSSWSYYLAFTHRTVKDINCITYCIIVCTNQCTYTKRCPILFCFFFIHRDGSASTQNGQIRWNNEKGRRFGAVILNRGYINSWGGWISDPRSISGRWRCFTIEDNVQKTIRQFQAAFPGGINRPSFKPSALLVLPFLNPRRHHPAAAGASPLHVHVTYRYGVTTLIIEVSRKTSM